MQLKWKRQQWLGTYWAKTATHKFAIDKIGSAWQLRIWTADRVLVKHFPPPFRTMALAKDAAQTYADQIGA